MKIHWALFIIIHSISLPLPIFLDTSHLSVLGSADLFHLFLMTMSIIFFNILIHSQHLPYSMLFYTKHRFQQIVATTSLCFLASHEDMLILQFGGELLHLMDVFYSFSFKAYNFIFIYCKNWFAYIFKTMNWILVISG